MSSNQEDRISGLPRRPRLGEASSGAILGAIALGIFTGGLGGALIGGVVGGALANQRQPLEMAIREHLKREGLEVVLFYLTLRGVKATFRYDENAYWTIESVMPNDLQLSAEDTADWLYGHLTTIELPKVLPRLKRAS